MTKHNDNPPPSTAVPQSPAVTSRPEAPGNAPSNADQPWNNADKMMEEEKAPQDGAPPPRDTTRT